MVESFITSQSCIVQRNLEKQIYKHCQEIKNYYFSNISVNKKMAIDICNKTLNQIGVYWKKLRQCRITGSSAYSFFTYAKGKNNDWDSKISSVLFSKFTGNSATKYGLENENDALKVFEQNFDVSVITLGFIVNINYPWFGFSPDGFIKCGIVTGF